MPDAAHLAAFALVCLGMVLTPGPNMAYLVSRTVGPRTDIWSEPSTVDAAAAEFADTEKFLLAGEKLFGPYGWGRADMISLPPSFHFGGMEHPNIIFLTPTLIAGEPSRRDHAMPGVAEQLHRMPSRCPAALPLASRVDHDEILLRAQALGIQRCGNCQSGLPGSDDDHSSPFSAKTREFYLRGDSGS